MGTSHLLPPARNQPAAKKMSLFSTNSLLSVEVDADISSVMPYDRHIAWLFGPHAQQSDLSEIS
jgi:hypothetical protein